MRVAAARLETITHVGEPAKAHAPSTRGRSRGRRLAPRSDPSIALPAAPSPDGGARAGVLGGVLEGLEAALKYTATSTWSGQRATFDARTLTGTEATRAAAPQDRLGQTVFMQDRRGGPARAGETAPRRAPCPSAGRQPPGERSPSSSGSTSSISSGQVELDPEAEHLLLHAVVEVALDPPPLALHRFPPAAAARARARASTPGGPRAAPRLLDAE